MKDHLVLLEKTDHVVLMQKEQNTAHFVNLTTKVKDVILSHVVTLVMELVHTVVLKTEIILLLSKKTTKEDMKDNQKIESLDHIADLIKIVKVVILNHVVRTIPKMVNAARLVVTTIDLAVAEIFVHRDLVTLNHVLKPTRIQPIL